MVTLLHSKYPRCHERLAKWEPVRDTTDSTLPYLDECLADQLDYRAYLRSPRGHPMRPNEKDWLHYKWEGWPLPEIESKWGEGYAHKNLTTHHLTKSGESYLYGVESQRPREWQEKQNRKDTK